MGICACRDVRGVKGVFSVHAECRAIDLAANANDPRHKELADKFIEWMIDNSDALGIQYIIWNRLSWKSGRGWQRYTGINPHTDHMHVEFNRDGAEVVHPLMEEDMALDALNDEDKAEIGRWMQEQTTNVITLVKGMIDDFNEAAAEREWKTRRIVADMLEASGVDQGKLSDETKQYLRDAKVA